jgi:hypothetical protein
VTVTYTPLDANGNEIGQTQTITTTSGPWDGGPTLGTFWVRIFRNCQTSRVSSYLINAYDNTTNILADNGIAAIAPAPGSCL